MTPDEFTLTEKLLDVSNGHQIYIHSWGNPSSKVPIVFLHGGPGNGCNDRDKQKFDPYKNHVIFFDQRGCGRSLPKGELHHNTTQDLVSDINKITRYLNLDKFALVGGSWGSTLALCYAIKYPDQVVGLVIDGVFTGTESAINWLDNGSWKVFFPEVWEEYVKSVPTSHSKHPSAYHYDIALSGDDESAKKSIYAYQKMELGLIKLDDQYLPEKFDLFDPTPGKIEIHYMANKCFLNEHYIQSNASKLSMPIYIIQGRFDMVCQPIDAYKLHKVLPNCQLIWTINGHQKQHEATNIQRILLGQLTESK